MTKTEALKLALEALEEWRLGRDPRAADKYITAIKEALAQPEQIPPSVHSNTHQPEQEPVAWAQFSEAGNLIDLLEEPCGGYAPLYTTPSQRTWVGMMDDEIDQGLLRSDYAFKTAEAWRAGVVFAMTKLKEKNGYAEEKNT